MSNPKDYSVGWICAITTEYVAAQSFLDEEHAGPEYISANDNNDYTLGRIGKHNVAIAVLPDGEYGISSATSVAKDMVHSFPNIRIGLMVGIGGGAPSKKHDIRLGDIVISAPRDGNGGVFQYDFGKTVQQQSFQYTGFLNQPPMVLRTAVSGLRSQYELKGHQLDLTISKILENRKRLKRKYSRPLSSTDLLYRTDIIHPLGDETGCAVLCGDSPSKLILRPERTEDDDIPSIHYGLIASANQLMKDALIRDTIASENDILCFEMEAAGLMNHFPCLVIRGISDYSDSHKNNAWQGYAAMAAAAYAKDLLYRIPPSKIETEKRIREVLSDVNERIIDMSQNITKIVRKQLDQELQAIIDWITPIDYSSQQNDFIASRQPGTGEWLINSEEFQNWMNQNKQTLFCPGIPGAGKTITTSIVVSYLHEKFQDNPNIGIAYLYLNFRRQSEQEPIHIFSSLLRRFSQMGSTIHDSVQKLYQKHNPKEEEIRPTSQIPPTRPSIDEIVNTLNQILTSYSRTYIIIDALDECTDSNLHRSTLMSEIFGLQTRLGVNLFFTSRFVPHIKADFENRECGTLEIRATDKDMLQYLDSNMAQLPAFIFQIPGLEERIKSSIIEASKGMFLLTKLHLDSLRDKISVLQVEDTLERLPRGSDAYQQTYYGAMGRIRAQKRGFCDLANRVLFWITCSRRPLSTLELQHALAVVDDSSALNPRNLTEIGLMVSVCAGLVTVDEHSDIIRLVHYTVQEYFERTCDTWFPNAQTDIAKTCITYLSFDIFKAGTSLTEEMFEAKSHSNVLYDYASCNWGHHVRIASNPDVNLLAVRFLESAAKASTRNQAMAECLTSRHYGLQFQETGGLHMAAYFGLEEPTKALLKKQDPDSEIQRWTPIQWASFGGHEAVVNLLLDHDANPKARDDIDSPLQLAVEQGHTAVTQILLEGDANPGEHHLEVLLELASRAGNIEMAQLLLRWHGHHLSHHYPLHVAAECGREAIVKLFLDQGLDLELQDGYGQTPLQRATANNHEAIIKLLLEKGANLESKDVKGQTPLLKAAQYGHIAILRLLLEEGADLESKDKEGRTPLQHAIDNSSEAAVKLLLEKGADLESKDKEGYTPLLVAINRGSEVITKLLLQKDANIKAEAESLHTSLIIAARHGDYQVIELLLESGANPDPKPGAYITALYSAAERGHIEIVRLLLNKGSDPGYTVGHSHYNLQAETAIYGAAEGGHEAVMRLLLDNGASLGDKDSWGAPLCSAAAKGHETVVKLLVESGVSPNIKSGSRRTPLLSATMGGHNGIVKLLLECGANPSASDADGITPLAQSAFSGHEAVVKLLLEHGADPDAGLVSRLTPLAAAAQQGHEAVARLLLESGANLEPGNGGGHYYNRLLYQASQMPHDAIVKLLLDKGAELESKHKTGWFARTPLHYASYIGYASMVRLFLENGANPDAKNMDGQTPLHSAIQRGFEEIVTLLLDKGADPNISARYMGPPINLAAEKGHAAIVKRLLDKGANPDFHLSIGTPLSLASRGGHEAIVKLLLDRGADPDSNSSIGTPLSISIEKGHETVAKVLLDKGANPNRFHWRQKSPLCIAAECGQVHVAKLLLEKGANLTDADYNLTDTTYMPFASGQQPIHLAASFGHEAVVRLLLNKGADPDAKDKYGQTPLYYATQTRYEAVIKLLLQSGASPNTTGCDRKTPLLRYLNPDGRDMIKLFLEMGMDTELKADEFRTLLHCSVQPDYTSITRLLLTYNADTETKDQWGETPLHTAAHCGRKVAAKVLLDKGANANSKCNRENTPLHGAARNGNEIVVKLLLDRGADIQAKNASGETPLHCAVSNRKGAVVKILLRRGADVHVKDNNGKTPLHVAESNGQEEIARLLLDRFSS